MLIRLERKPDHLEIETRRSASLRDRIRIASILLVSALIVGFEIAMLAVFVEDQPWPFATSIGLVVATVVFVLPALYFAGVIALERERISVHGQELRYERFLGRRVVQSGAYRLLEMHGLRSHAQVRVVLPDGTPLTSDAPALELRADASATGPQTALPQVLGGLVFWYHNEPHWIGRTLAFSEYGLVAQALLDYDRDIRCATGLPQDKGLRDLSVWDYDALFLITEANHLDTRGRRGRIV